MSKLRYEDKITIYERRCKGEPLSTLASKYQIRRDNLAYLMRLIDKHGYDVLRTNKNKNYNKYEKEEIINRIIIGRESIVSVAIDFGLSSDGLLHNWINKYKENSYNIVERKRGRSSMPKLIKKKEKETIEEENKRLKDENEYLKAELEYSKKLRAVVQARKSQQQKKK